jgi:hypothetical protein
MNREDIIRMAEQAGMERCKCEPRCHLHTGGMGSLTYFAKLVAAATLKNSVMTDEEHEQAMADESQRTRLTFDAEVIEMVKEAVEMEREACARVCENIYEGDEGCGDWPTPEMCAEAIRARGQG